MLHLCSWYAFLIFTQTKCLFRKEILENAFWAMLPILWNFPVVHQNFCPFIRYFWILSAFRACDVMLVRGYYSSCLVFVSLGVCQPLFNLFDSVTLYSPLLYTVHIQNWIHFPLLEGLIELPPHIRFSTLTSNIKIKWTKYIILLAETDLFLCWLFCLWSFHVFYVRFLVAFAICWPTKLLMKRVWLLTFT